MADEPMKGEPLSQRLETLYNDAAEIASTDNIEAPGFENADEEDDMDWRNYVPASLIEVWGHLSEETRMALFVQAQFLSETIESHSDDDNS